MSYCRMGWDSDVYVIRNFEQTLECLGCRVAGERKFFSCRTNDEMIRHLGVHKAAGQKVPARALERLEREKYGGWT